MLKMKGQTQITIIVALKSMVSCEILDLDASFQGTCFRSTFSKAC
jgi:hypothetical protein